MFRQKKSCSINDSYRFRALTVKLNELQPVGEVASNPVQSHTTYTIVFEFVKQNIMIDGIKGLRKIKENANGANC